MLMNLKVTKDTRSHIESFCLRIRSPYHSKTLRQTLRVRMASCLCFWSARIQWQSQFFSDCMAPWQCVKGGNMASTTASAHGFLYFFLCNHLSMHVSVAIRSHFGSSILCEHGDCSTMFHLLPVFTNGRGPGAVTAHQSRFFLDGAFLAHDDFFSWPRVAPNRVSPKTTEKPKATCTRSFTC